MVYSQKREFFHAGPGKPRLSQALPAPVIPVQQPQGIITEEQLSKPKAWERPAPGFMEIQLAMRETLMRSDHGAQATAHGDVVLVQPTYENRKLEGAEEKLSLAEQLRAGLVKNDNCPGKK